MQLKKGDYVVATKYSDGSPNDHFCVGFYDSETHHTKPRHMVVDENGVQFRHNGFGRVKRIRKDVGEKLVQNMKIIEQGSKSVWSWVRKFERF